MAKKVVYSKGFEGFSDFVYVDLLPDVKRPRQFNMNVILVLTFAVVLAFVLVYMPFRNTTDEFEDVNGLNSDLRHELLLTNEELHGYEIDQITILFEDNIGELALYKVDYNYLLDDLKILIELKNINYTTELTRISYNSILNTFDITVESTSNDIYNYLNNGFLNLEWVSYSTYDQPVQVTGAVLWNSTFTIGVDNDAE